LESPCAVNIGTMYNRAIPVFVFCCCFTGTGRRSQAAPGSFMGDLGRFFCLYRNGANWLPQPVSEGRSR